MWGLGEKSVSEVSRVPQAKLNTKNRWTRKWGRQNTMQMGREKRVDRQKIKSNRQRRRKQENVSSRKAGEGKDEPL